MWAVALRTTGNRELASDCVQDAFISAFRRASSYRGDAAVTTWLHRIVVNACLDRLRRDKPTSILPEYELADRHDAHASVDVRLDVRQALDRLPEGQRLALILVDMHGMSIAEAAAVLEVAEGTVKSRCSRGRDAMAELLREPSGQP
jgi:RNA polymerase sigma-70 factor (ECF subfamily)